ncbi:MAG TPA: T9SS type A sorting domain-containing protein [Phnomibacter sp.]|nr:T9SS type A sorting domain-containing protein [Phnomibacter sp.]
MKRFNYNRITLITLFAIFSHSAFSQTGVLDQATFGAGLTGGAGYGSRLAITSTNKIIVGGDFTTVAGTTKNNIARFNADGTLDAGFNPGGSGANFYVRAIRVRSDNKIWIGGSFIQYNGVAVPGGIILLNEDGTRDFSFNPASGTAAPVFSLGILPSTGDIVAGGQFTSFNGTTGIGKLARISETGVLNTTFNTNIGTGATGGDVEVVLVQPDEKIIVAGSFTTWNGAASGKIVRLNADGTLDATFNTNVGTGAGSTIRGLAVQSNGNILVGGDFTAWNGTTGLNRLVKLSPTGVRDASFTAGASGPVTSVRILSNDKFAITGNFGISGTLTPNNLKTRNGISVFNADGTADEGFIVNPGTNSGAFANDVALQPDGKLVITGSFNQVNGVSRIGVARFCGGLAASGAETSTITGISAYNVYALGSASCTVVGKIVPNGASPLNGANVTVQSFVDGSVQKVGSIPYLPRHYEISTTGGTGTDARVTLYFSQADFDAFNAVPNGADLPFDAADVDGNKSNIRFSKYPGPSAGGTGNPANYSGTATLIDPDDNDIVWNPISASWEVTFNVSGFSGFFMQTSINVLPLQLKSFTAAAIQDGAKLSWSTSSEQNTIHFVIERSVDGSYFHPTAKIAAAGNSQTSRNYLLLDNLTKVPHGGTVFYRLQMVDKDGSATYSNVQTVKLTKANIGAALLTNPVQSEARIMYQAGANENLNFRLLDSHGRLVSQQQSQVVAGSNQIRISTANLAKGMYLLEVSSKAGRNTIRLIKD